MRRIGWIGCFVCALALLAGGQQPAWEAPYRQACALAQKAEASQAVAALEAAFAAGLHDVDKVLHDPELESLHGDAEFRALLKPRMVASKLNLAGKQEPGEPILVRCTVLDAESKPAAGATVLAFQADASGKYTREKAMDEPHARLFGYLRCDENGRFELQTIFPGYYSERPDYDGPESHIPAHIHLHISEANGKTSQLQLVFSDDPRMGHEYWRQWAREHGNPIARVRNETTGRVADAAILLTE